VATAAKAYKCGLAENGTGLLRALLRVILRANGVLVWRLCVVECGGRCMMRIVVGRKRRDAIAGSRD